MCRKRIVQLSICIQETAGRCCTSDSLLLLRALLPDIDRTRRNATAEVPELQAMCLLTRQ
jgi:hypothetical protein